MKMWRKDMYQMAGLIWLLLACVAIGLSLDDVMRNAPPAEIYDDIVDQMDLVGLDLE